jgi:dTDP-4-amino-4,6-dideoxy-D-galactose acyltransferase
MSYVGEVAPPDQEQEYRVKLLRWDTDFFGYGVGLLDSCFLTDPWPQRTLEYALKLGIRLGYCFVESTALLQKAEDLGGVLVDTKTIYTLSLKSPLQNVSANPKITIQPYPYETVNEELLALAHLSGVHSRFRIDPKVGFGKFQALYALWIARSVKKEIAFEVLTAMDNETGKIAGMLTLGEKQGRGDIGLVGVSADFAGQGIGSALVQAALIEFYQRGYSEVQVVTQGENKPICKLCEKCGFQVEAIKYVFHFWL